MAVNPTSLTPLFQQVAEDIRRKIASGELPVGTKLETNRELALRYEVSLVTVNKALTSLASEGLLYSRVGRGTFVSSKPAPLRQIEGRLFGFVLRDLSSPYFSLIAHAAQQRADAEGYGLLFSSSSGRLDKEEEQIRRFRRLGVDALIIASMSRTYRISDAVRALHVEKFPYVMVSFTHGEDIPFIGTDLERTGYLATRHLVSLGRERIGFISDRQGSVPGELRKQGYRRALEEHGKALDASLEYEYPLAGEWNDYRSGYMIGEQVASREDRPDAMFVFNDLGAMGFQDAVLDHGLRVPQDIAIVGVDDVEQSARARVPLTTVRQPTNRIGDLAVEVLIRRLRGERCRNRHFLEPELIVRNSCGAPVRASVAETRVSSHDRAYARLVAGAG